MKHVLNIFSFWLLLLIASSCSTTYIAGKNFDDTKVSSVIIGKTNKSQVLQMFGDPFQQGLINQFTVFIYTYEENEFPAHAALEVYIDKKYKSLMIVFNENDVVKNFTYNVPLSPGMVDMMILKEEKIKQQDDENNL